MATTVDKIKNIEDEMAKTQKNKATSFHLGQLKAKLAKLKRELLTPQGGGGGGGVVSMLRERVSLQLVLLAFRPWANRLSCRDSPASTPRPLHTSLPP